MKKNQLTRYITLFIKAITYATPPAVSNLFDFSSFLKRILFANLFSIHIVKYAKLKSGNDISFITLHTFFIFCFSLKYNVTAFAPSIKAKDFFAKRLFSHPFLKNQKDPKVSFRILLMAKISLFRILPRKYRGSFLLNRKPSISFLFASFHKRGVKLRV